MRDVLAFLALLAVGRAGEAQLATRVNDLVAGPVQGSSEGLSDLRVIGKRAVVKVGSRALFGTDGTISGTHELAAGGAHVGVLGEALLYRDAVTIWRTDGTVGGTWPLVSPLLGARLGQLSLSIDDRWLIAPAETETGGRELIVSRGQEEDSVFLDLLPGPSGVDPRRLRSMRGEALIVGALGDVWATDGTLAGSRELLRVGGGVVDVLVAGGQAYVLGAGGDLWVTDGTVTGSGLVAHIADGEFFDALALGSRVFVAVRESSQDSLWVSDGTNAGTLQLAAFPRFGLDALEFTTPSGVVFRAQSAQQQQFWLSEGSRGSTQSLSAAPFGTREQPIVPFGDGFLFLARTQQGQALWRSRGTAASQQQVAEVPLARSLYTLGEHALIVAGLAELWGSDGTAVGTQLLIPDAPYVVFEDERVLVARGREVLETDGTIRGTRIIASSRRFKPFDGVFGEPFLAGLGDEVVFLALGEDFSFGVWVSVAGAEVERIFETTRVRDGAGRESMVASGSFAFFLIGDNLWQHDGTAAHRLASAQDAGCSRWDLVDAHEDRALLTCARGSSQQLISIGSGAAAEVLGTGFRRQAESGFARVGDLLFLATDDAVWRSDATRAGTVRLLTVDPGESVTSPIGSLDIGYFFVRTDSEALDVYSTDLTAGGTARLSTLTDVSTLGNGAVAASGHLYFQYDSAARARSAIWSVGPTSALRPSSGPEPDSGTPLLAWGSGVVYRRDVELVHTDGSSWRSLGSYYSSSRSFGDVSVLGDRLVFAGQHPTSPRQGLRVVEPNGAVGSIDVGAAGLGGWSPDQLTVVDDRLFFTAHHPVLGNEIWSTDGTQSGTRLVHDLWPGRGSSFPRTFRATRDRLYFVADDGIVDADRFVLDPSNAGCLDTGQAVCLNGGRFRAEMTWTDFSGSSGAGAAKRLTDDTGYFWFFDEDNVEAVIKVLDGTSINDSYWVFSGSLSNVNYTLTVTDSMTGGAKRYLNPSGNFGSFGDVEALGDATRGGVVALGSSALSMSATSPSEITSCVSDQRSVCLNDNRFLVSVDWRTRQGTSGSGRAVQLTEDTGYFWFFDDENVDWSSRSSTERPSTRGTGCSMGLSPTSSTNSR